MVRCRWSRLGEIVVLGFHQTNHTLPLIVFKQVIHRNDLIYLADAGWTVPDWKGSDQGVEELFFGELQSSDFFAHFNILC